MTNDICLKVFSSLLILASILPIRECNGTDKIIKVICAFVFFTPGTAVES